MFAALHSARKSIVDIPFDIRETLLINLIFIIVTIVVLVRSMVSLILHLSVKQLCPLLYCQVLNNPTLTTSTNMCRELRWLLAPAGSIPAPTPATLAIQIFVTRWTDRCAQRAQIPVPGCSLSLLDR